MFKEKMTDQQKKNDKKVKVSQFSRLIVCRICKRSGGTLKKIEKEIYQHIKCPTFRI